VASFVIATTIVVVVVVTRVVTQWGTTIVARAVTPASTSPT
jgi:hypothetical protein